MGEAKKRGTLEERIAQSNDRATKALLVERLRNKERRKERKAEIRRMMKELTFKERLQVRSYVAWMWISLPARYVYGFFRSAFYNV